MAYTEEVELELSTYKEGDLPEDLAMLTAQQYFVDWGTNMTPELLAKHLPQYIPAFCVTVDKPYSYWSQQTLKAYEKVAHIQR